MIAQSTLDAQLQEADAACTAAFHRVIAARRRSEADTAVAVEAYQAAVAVYHTAKAAAREAVASC